MSCVPVPLSWITAPAVSLSITSMPSAMFVWSLIVWPAPVASAVWRFRLTQDELTAPLEAVDGIVGQRRAEADEFYATVHPPKATDDERLVQRQALAGMLWSKSIYLFDVARWFDGDDTAAPPPRDRLRIRNTHWRHLNSMRVLSLPDKWEYPWFAAWDLAFHCVSLALVGGTEGTEAVQFTREDGFGKFPWSESQYCKTLARRT